MAARLRPRGCSLGPSSREPLCALARLAFMETNPLPAKTAIEALGFGSAEFRLPLTPMSDAGRESLLAGLREHGVLE